MGFSRDISTFPSDSDHIHDLIEFRSYYLERFAKKSK